LEPSCLISKIQNIDIKHMNQSYPPFETSSLPLATTLTCLGITLDSVIKSNSGKAVFVFSQTPELNQILESFWRKDLRIEPITFFEAQRYLKSRIYG
jgi:hypothetical protein